MKTDRIADKKGLPCRQTNFSGIPHAFRDKSMKCIAA